MYLKMASPPDDRKDRSPKYKLVFDIFSPVVGFFVLLYLNCPSFSYPALTTLIWARGRGYLIQREYHFQSSLSASRGVKPIDITWCNNPNIPE